MKHCATILVWLFVLSLTACRTIFPESSPAVTSIPEHRTAVASPAMQINTPTPAFNEMEPVRFNTIAEAEQSAGFKIQTPDYLPEGVSFDYVTYQQTPNPSVTLYFKIVHPQYGDMGSFFHVLEEPQVDPTPDMITCGEPKDGVCELFTIGGIPVIYHQYPGGTEGLDWCQNRMVYRLLRTAGEPGKVYKDELVEVVASLK